MSVGDDEDGGGELGGGNGVKLLIGVVTVADGDTVAGALDEVDAEGDVVEVGLPTLFFAAPTCAGGGNDSTGLFASASVIICCHVAAAPEPNMGAPPSVTGALRSWLPYQTAVDSCGVKPMNHASKFDAP